MTPLILVLALVGIVPLAYIISNAVINWCKLDIAEGVKPGNELAETGTPKDEILRLRKENADIKKRLENLETIVTSSVWDQQTSGKNVSAPDTMTDVEQAEWLAKQISSDQRRIQ